MSGTGSRESLANWTIRTVCHLFAFLHFHSECSGLFVETYSAMISCVEFHLQTHPQIITSRLKRITMAQLNGFSKAAYPTNGSPLVRFCGYMENVCSSCSSIRHIRPDHLNHAAGSGKTVQWFVLPHSSYPTGLTR